ncbi:hypothetical protein ACFOLA_04365 [Salinicoccus hispanicus]|uniref:Uncharacterized protein n=1 Tax=Salinicoccus hispanicus TaxID=157225 RepID=A0A6N8U8P2_9STAP|nr:hypothetical protein [Salinicoccus hispanicus]MXQ52049.1 hypothetical protein [Salinicoccus hispanicus]
MFYNLLYFNENLYDTYYAFASAGQAVEFREIESQTDKGAQLGFDSTQFGLGKSSVIKGEIINNAPSKLISLEKSLEHNDYFVDFETGDPLRHIEDLSRRMIFRATMPLKIHEDFDMYEMSHLMKTQLINSGLMGSTSDDADLFNMVFDFDKVKLPVYNNDMDTLIFSRIHKDCILIEENEFDELGEDNIILAKVKRIYEGTFTLFDPLKDFMNLDSNARKVMENDIGNQKQLQPIIMDANAIEVEIIAIYS